MKIDEIKALPDKELLVRIGELKREHMNLRFSKVMSEVKNISRMRMIKRDVARLFTILNQRRK
ncbi:50S ribosomal protein L29 [Candidatus Cyrtobacter comes]|uniref:Large ribosomal subunit protein uL29 n=1 Tax=Candidatus Cyrtobacter comes TaxID=675776 RepID=A0ABU5L6I2_9RICK|nr:50S ribosomal protein L29 [Candidatus Cyrtobacter comes]MDZ5761730.1 50S ribosomal protein L29 [Candidatus Cyrtobacter comes]